MAGLRNNRAPDDGDQGRSAPDSGHPPAPPARGRAARRPASPVSAEADEPTSRPATGHGWPVAGRGRRADDGDGALRGLVGAGRSKLSLSAAMRARDVARPDADDLAEADRVIAARLEGRSGGGRPRGWPGPRAAGRPAGAPRPGSRQTAGGAGSPDGTGGSSPVRS